MLGPFVDAQPADINNKIIISNLHAGTKDDVSVGFNLSCAISRFPMMKVGAIRDEKVDLNRSRA
jgi:hypothetical protein